MVSPARALSAFSYSVRDSVFRVCARAQMGWGRGLHTGRKRLLELLGLLGILEDKGVEVS